MFIKAVRGPSLLTVKGKAYGTTGVKRTLQYALGFTRYVTALDFNPCSAYDSSTAASAENNTYGTVLSRIKNPLWSAWPLEPGSWQIADRYTMLDGERSSPSSCSRRAFPRTLRPVEPQLVLELCGSRNIHRHRLEDQGERARPALGAGATVPAGLHAVSMVDRGTP